MVQWRIQRDQTTTVTASDGLYDVEIGDTSNPFGNYGLAFIRDDAGDAFDNYPRGTRIDFEYKSTDLSGEAFGYGQNYGKSYGGSAIGTSSADWNTRFVGFVVERRELDRSGADSLEIECYSFDQFLRRSYVTNDQSGKTIEAALKDIIQTDTPVDWNVNKVDVGDNRTLSRPYQDERVDNAIRSMATLSTGEEWGVDQTLDFFFRPGVTTTATRDIDNSQWTDFDIPEVGKETINQATVWYDDGAKSVTVSDGAAQLDLQDQVGAASPVKFETEVSRRNITSLDEAQAVAEQILSDREATLTGTVTTYGLLETRPGDIIDVTITPRGIDDSYRIADITYKWAADETTITIVERKEGETDRARRVSDTLKRVELRGTAGSPTSDTAPEQENIVIDPTVRALVNLFGDVNGTTYDTAAITNYARNRIRDAWGEGDPITVSEIAVGDDSTAATKTDSQLGNELARNSINTTNTPSSDRVEFGYDDFSTTSIREVGLFDSTGTLLARATIPSTSLSAPVGAGIGFDIANDGDVAKGIVTNTGQTATRDIINADATGSIGKYAFGSDDTAVTESDTSMTSNVATVNLDEVLLEYLDSDADWNGELTLGASDPVVVEDGAVKLAQSLWWQEADKWSDRDGTTRLDLDDFSFGRALTFASAGEYLTWSFTTDYDVAKGDFGLAIRWRTSTATGSDTPVFEVRVDGEDLGTWDVANTSINWSQDIIGDNANSGEVDPPSSDLAAGEHTVTLECTTGNSGSTDIDVVAPFDTRFSYNYDNTTSGTGAAATLAGPEEYPDEFQLDFDVYDTRQEIESATVTQTWTDTTNKQAISLSNDGSAYTKTNNSNSASASFASASRELYVRVFLSRFGGGNSQRSPTDGDQGQQISDSEREGDINPVSPVDTGVAEVRAVVAPGTIGSNTKIKEAGQLDSSDTALTHSTFAEVLVESSDRLIASERIGWANGSVLAETDSITAASGIIDDFEDNDITEYAGDTGGYTTQTGTVYEGTYALHGTDTSGSFQLMNSQSGLPRYPQSGDTVSYRFRIGSGTTDTGFDFGHQGSFDNTYRVVPRPASGFEDFRLLVRDGGNQSTLASASVTWHNYDNEWLEIIIDWGSSGTITATAKDAAGNQIAQISATDTTYSSGGIGWEFAQSAQDTYFDIAEIV